MSRSSFAVFVAMETMLLVAGSVRFCRGATRSAPPNVVVIYTDDQNLNDLGCYGGNIPTPYIDGLARDGMRFTQYYPASPVCNPSRYNLLTGQYASRSKGLQQEYPVNDHAFITWNADFVPDEFTIARALKQQGYTTGMVGKWHNGLGGWDNGLPATLHRIERDADPEDPSVRDRVRENYERIRDRVKNYAGFDYAESIYGENFMWLPLPRALQVHNQDWVTKGAIDFLQQNHSKPFFLYMSTTIPHGPAALLSLKSDPRATPAGFLEQPLKVQPSHKDVLKRAEAAGYRKDNGEKSRWVALAWLDDGVGAVLQKLKELDLADNTVVIFASDHASRGKMTCYAGNVPCVIRGDGIQAGSVCDELVSNIDLAPTIFDLCGASPPKSIPVDGRSLVPLLTSEPVAWRDSLFFEITYTRAVMTPGWKYIATRYPPRIATQITTENRREFNQEGARISQGSARSEHVRYHADRDFPGYYDDDQLYDMKQDPQQQHNLATNPNHAAVLQEMKRRLRDDSLRLPHPFAEFTK